MEPFAEISRSCGHNVLEWNGNNDKEENYYICQSAAGWSNGLRGSSEKLSSPRRQQ